MSPPSDRLHVFFPVVQPACVCLRSWSGLASGLVLTEAGGCLRWISSSSKVEVWGDLVILVRADSSALTPCELMACFVPRAVRRRQQCDLPAFVEHFCIFIIFLKIFHGFVLRGWRHREASCGIDPVRVVFERLFVEVYSVAFKCGGDFVPSLLRDSLLFYL